MFAPNLNKPQGLLGSYGMNPLMALGSGLLSAGGYTTMPVSTGQGLAAGFENMQRQGLLSAQMQRQEQEDAYRQQILDMKRAEAERQAAAQRAQGEGMAGLLAQVPPEHRATVAAIAAVDPKRGVEVAQGLVMPEPEKLPGSVQEALWLQSATPEQRAAYIASKRAGASSTNVNVGSGPKWETSVGKAINDYMLALEKFGPDDPRTKSLAEAALPKSEQGVVGTQADVALYEKRALDAVDAFDAAYEAFKKNPGTGTKAAMDQARSAMNIAVAQARNPKGEPGDILIRQADEAMPGGTRGLLQSSVGLGDPVGPAIEQLRSEFGGRPQRQPVSVNILTPQEQAELDRLRAGQQP